jgi:hypothetical protein
VSEIFAKVVRVDGINNVLLDIPRAAFAEVGVEPDSYPKLAQPISHDVFRVKVGAAGSRYIGDIAHLGQEPRRWPIELPANIAELVAAGIPHAAERIATLRGRGTRAPAVVYSNDLARVRREEPSSVSERYRATAESSLEYEALVQEIKATREPVAKKAEKLGNVVLLLGAQEQAIRRGKPDLPDTVGEARAGALTPLARAFLESSEMLAKKLGAEIPHDWSGVVIGLCKAVEAETIDRVLETLKAELSGETITATEFNDRDVGRVARYCAGEARYPPELGAIRRFLRVVEAAKPRHGSSVVVERFRRLSERWPASSWLTDATGAGAAFGTLTRQYRNRAAHMGQLSRDDYVECRELVAGEDGILWKLVSATSGPSSPPRQAAA